MRLLVWTRACQSRQVFAWMPAWQCSRILQLLDSSSGHTFGPFCGISSLV